jgi:hypothetical protein
MKLDEIKKLVKTDRYSFFEKDEHLGNNICLLTLGGSHAYGMDTNTSDVDIRGCALNLPKEILTGNYYEQFTNDETDTVIYTFNKIIGLMENCNPNVIEMLGCKPEHYLYLSDVGKELIENKEMFLSKRCVNSFGGYANQQLRRLQNAMARDSYPKNEKEKHILNTIRNMKYHLAEVYPGYGENSLRLYIDKSARPNLETEIFVDFDLKKFPLRDYRGIMAEMNTVINEYSKLNKRNTKKDDNHLMKHMAHLLRLYMMAIDILAKKQIITYRKDEHDLLMDIRNGRYLTMADNETIAFFEQEAAKLRSEFNNKKFNDELEYELGKKALEKDIDKMMTGIYKVSDEFWDIFNEYEKKFTYAKKHTELPDNPDYNRINDFKMETNLKIIKEFSYLRTI